MERTIKEYEWKEKIEKGKWIEKETYNENAFQIRLFISPSLWFEFQEHFWKMKFFAICLMKSNKSIHVHEKIYFLFRLNLWKNYVQFTVHSAQSGGSKENNGGGQRGICLVIWENMLFQCYWRKEEHLSAERKTRKKH